jgi:hypothetical protein
MAENYLKKSLSVSTHALRIRWAAIGAAIAVSLGGGVTLFAQAGTAPASSSTFVAVSPVRVLDTRDAVVLWAGPFVTGVPHDVKVTGAIPTSSGTQTVMPAGSTGVVLNVTVLNSTADGFVSVRPADAVDAPKTSNINFEARKTVANSITVNLPTSGADAGTFEVWFDSMGVAGATADILVDITGYYSANALDLKSDAIAIIGSGGEDFGDIQLTASWGAGIVWDNGIWVDVNSTNLETWTLYFDSSNCSGTPWKTAWAPEVSLSIVNNVGRHYWTNYDLSTTFNSNNFHSTMEGGECVGNLGPSDFKLGGEHYNLSPTDVDTDLYTATDIGLASEKINLIWAHLSGANAGINSLSFVPRSSIPAVG